MSEEDPFKNVINLSEKRRERAQQATPQKEETKVPEVPPEEDELWSVDEALEYAERELLPVIEGTPAHDPLHALRNYAREIGDELDDDNIDRLQEKFNAAYERASAAVQDWPDDELINLIQDHDDGDIGQGDDLLVAVAAAETLKGRHT